MNKSQQINRGNCDHFATPSEEEEKRRILEYWNQQKVESMYDKCLLKTEIELIKNWIPKGAKILDVGCGEGEGTLEYSKIGQSVHAVDFSTTRLELARNRTKAQDNIVYSNVDMLAPNLLDSDYDIIISQRFLINLLNWEQQKSVICNLMGRLKKGGRLLLLEGSQQGAETLNQIRKVGNLSPIPIKWHNRFLDDQELSDFIYEQEWKVCAQDGLGFYFMLTRAIRPLLDDVTQWDCSFNQIAARRELRELCGIDQVRCSRLKLWVIAR
jgi:2-polyprenyl-3-methyl-5-hydroxy-6-metoxy-1,4-benzoquinol methylase